ncbi:hypothetical protein H0H92_003489 [Tricholoma furcatifolium]|nr:hypothetical protein H0H92_003489 [Tricholoma furcatifolium]
MSYAQANELKLIDPYLELLGVENIQDLRDSTGTPPNDDPQIYLGTCWFDEDKFQWVGEDSDTPLNFELIDSNPSLTTATNFALMPRNNRGSSHNRYEPYGRERHEEPRPTYLHPWMRQDPDTQTIYIECPGHVSYSIHPLQMAEYIIFDREQLAEIHNAIPIQQYLYRMVTYDGQRREYIIPRQPARRNMVPHGFVDPRYQPLQLLGVIVPDGTVDEQGIQDVNAALRRSHGDNVKKSKLFYRRKTELKKVREIEDDNLDDANYDKKYNFSENNYSRTPTPDFHSTNPSYPITHLPTYTATTYNSYPQESMVNQGPMTPVHDSNFLPTIPGPSLIITTITTDQSILQADNNAIAGPGPSTIAAQQSMNAVAGPGPSTLANQQLAQQNALDQVMDQFLETGDGAPMDQKEDHRDEFLKDFEAL